MAKKCPIGKRRVKGRCVKKNSLSEKYVNKFQSRSFSNPHVMKSHILSDTPFESGIRTYNTKTEATKDFNKTKAMSKKLGIHLEKHQVKKYKDAIKEYN